MKKLVTLLLVLSMVVTSLLGCGSKEEAVEESTTTESTNESAEAAEDIFNAEGYPVVNEAYTIKIMQLLPDSRNLKAPDEITAVQMLEEQTGIDVEWEQVRESDWDTKLSLMFASEEYPDIILIGDAGAEKVNVEDYGVSQGLLLPLDELIDQYMPNYTARIAMEEMDPTEPNRASDGKMYSLGYMIGSGFKTGNHFYINQTWLDALKLETPETPEQLTEVLRAFKNQDPNGNGEADEIPLASCNEYDYLCLFGLTNPYDYRWMRIDDNKQVQFVPTDDNFRACVEWMHELYEEELIDPEMFSQDWDTYCSKLQNEKCGMFVEWRLKNSSFMNAADDCVLWVPGGEAAFTHTISSANSAAFITVGCERPEIAARLLDTMIQDDIMYSAYIGAQGDPFIGWDYNEDGKMEMYEYMDDEGYDQYMSEPWNFMNTAWLNFVPGNYYQENYAMNTDWIDKTAYCDAYDEAGIIATYASDYLLRVKFTSEEEEELNRRFVDIDTYTQENWVTFIQSGVTDESWDAFVKGYEDMNVAELIQKYQAGIDAMDVR